MIRSMQADVPNHIPSILLMNCGDARLIRPSLGSWVTYGLGSENQNLPGFVAMRPGGQAWIGSDWDHHENLAAGHRRLAKQCDQAIGALLKDLKQRGMLDDTLVIWGGEFGRTPTVELPMGLPNNTKGNGRDHNHHGFTTMAHWCWSIWRGHTRPRCSPTARSI